MYWNSILSEKNKTGALLKYIDAIKIKQKLEIDVKEEHSLFFTFRVFLIPHSLKKLPLLEVSYFPSLSLLRTICMLLMDKVEVWS